MRPSDDLIVSSVEPTGKNRKKVWMQKGKNLFDKNDIITDYRIGLNGKKYQETGYFISGYIPVKGGTYTVNYSVEALRRIAWYDSNKNLINYTDAFSTFILPENASFIRICGPIDILDSAQLEQNSVATPYEAYIEPKIYVKTGNDIYEEFINAKDINKKEEETYSDEEQVIGNWCGATLYRKVVVFNTLPNSSIKSVPHNITNLNKIVNLYGRADNGTAFLPIPYTHMQPELNIALYANNENVSIETGSNRTSFTSCAIMLEYIKTTN